MALQHDRTQPTRCVPGLAWVALLALAFGAAPGVRSANAGATGTNAEPRAILVVGIGGTDEYQRQFDDWADQWAAACERGATPLERLGPSGSVATSLRDALARAADGTGPLWLVLLGHGSFDGREARFNVAGPDITAGDLAQWLQPLERPVAVIHVGSSSGPFLPELSAANRVIVTATKSGAEQNFARFGGFLAGAIADPRADIDRDDQTSLLEAFLAAARRTTEFYQQQGRLATEHSLLDDDGDGKGTPAEWYRGLELIEKPEGATQADGQLAHQWHLVPSPAERRLPPKLRARRDALELAVLKLRARKAEFASEEAYLRELETRLVALALVYEEIDALVPGAEPTSEKEAAAKETPASR